MATVEKVCQEIGVDVVAHKTVPEILACENRQMALQREYLESIGWVTEDFLVKRSAGDKKLAKQLYLEIQQILKEERESA